jgi:ABC-type branched-subunit amino acid transport system substrate-binding protein
MSGFPGGVLGRLRRAHLVPYALAAALALVVAVVTNYTALKPSSARQMQDARTGELAIGAKGAALGSSQTGGAGRSRRAAGRQTRSTISQSGSRIPGAIYDPGVTDDEILVGGSTFTSGPAAVYGEQIAVGFQAGVNYINDHGGINGRRVVAKIYDDAGDPLRQLSNTKRLVQVDKVFSLSMVYAPIAGSFVSQAKVPVFHEGQFNEEFTNPWWFATGGAQRGASYAIADFGANYLKAKSAAIFYLDVGAANYSRAYALAVKKDWEAWGVKVPVLVGFAADQASCSDAISQAKAAGVDFIDFEIDASKVINCGVNAQLNGYKPPKGWGGYLIGVPVIHEALGDFSIGMYAFDAFGALYDVPEYAREVKGVSSKTEWYSSVTAGYFVAALMMRDAIAKLGNNITRERLRQEMNTFTRWRPAIVNNNDNFPWYTFRSSCHLGLHGGYAIQIQKTPSGDLKWKQVTPQIRKVALPPNTPIPADFRSCPDNFTTGSVFGKYAPK